LRNKYYHKLNNVFMYRLIVFLVYNSKSCIFVDFVCK